MMRVVSIQVGKVVTGGDPNTRDVTKKWWASAFEKRPVEGSVIVGPMGIDGDEVADHKHHGGVDKAVLCYAMTHYAAWSELHPELQMGPGGFGENLTIQGQDEASVCVGDRYRLGSAEIEISQPREPCWKIARRWGVKSLVKEVAQTGRSGWYARITLAGTIAAGDELILKHRPHPDWSVARAGQALIERDADAAESLKSLPELSDAFKESL